MTEEEEIVRALAVFYGGWVLSIVSLFVVFVVVFSFIPSDCSNAELVSCQEKN